jgi:citrate synthase
MVDQRRIDNQRLVDARTAAKHLGIQLRSLYAYVSRGQVRSVPGEHGRPRLYSLDDLERLRVRRDARAGHGAVAAGALRWGEPVLDSAVTAITPHGPAYRGRLAVDLARAGTPFENVAELLWSGYLPDGRITWPRIAVPLAQLARLLPADATPMDVMPLVVQTASLADRTRDDRRPDAIITRGRQLIPLLAAALAPGFTAASVSRALGAPSVAEVAARALGLDDAAAPLLERVLVVLADHELNASSFTARVTASTDADPYACVAAALATLSGPKHGTASLDVMRFADEVGSPEAARNAVRALARKQQAPPGFGHTLYPHGDPRTAPLLEAVATLPGNKRSRTLLAIVAATKGSAPTVDVGLAALVAALGLPPTVGAGLFAVARSAGWLAHALEQRAAGYLLRPRARYTGVPVA